MINWTRDGRPSRGVRPNPPHHYLRITAGGKYRSWYEHRAVADMMLRNNHISSGFVPSLPKELPKDWEVHHMDANRHHNCSYNLLISPPELHVKPGHTANGQMRHPYTGKFLSKEETERMMEQGMIEDTRVPF